METVEMAELPDLGRHPVAPLFQYPVLVNRSRAPAYGEGKKNKY